MAASGFKLWPARTWLAAAGCLVTVYTLQVLSAGSQIPVCPLPGSLPAPRIVPAKITSQAGQDGAIRSIFEAIGTRSEPFYVEFGFNAPSFEGGSGANTYQLHLRGWRGLLMDGGNENATINLRKHMLTPENVCGLFRTYSVPLDLDYLSVDVDGLDLWILRALFQCGFRPRLVTIEYNPNLPASSCLTVAPDAKKPGSICATERSTTPRYLDRVLARWRGWQARMGTGSCTCSIYWTPSSCGAICWWRPEPRQCPSKIGSGTDVMVTTARSRHPRPGASSTFGAEAGGSTALERAREKAVREVMRQGQRGSPCSVTIVDPMAEPG